MNKSRLAKLLNLARNTLNKYISLGMPTDDLEEAQAWLANHKPARAKESRDAYKSKDIGGDDSQARFARLQASEKYLSGQIATIQEDILPQLISAMADASEDERQALEKRVIRVNADLLSLRREHRQLSRSISDIEFRRAAAAGGNVPYGYIVDLLNAALKPIFQYTHNLPDQNIARHVARLFSEGLEKFIRESEKVPPGYEGDAIPLEELDPKACLSRRPLTGDFIRPAKPHLAFSQTVGPTLVTAGMRFGWDPQLAIPTD